jgi:hypothetical protein
MSFIKVERTLLERLTLAIGWLSHRGYDEPYTLLRNSYEEGNWREGPGRLFPDLTRNGFNSLRHVSWTDLIDQSTEAMKSAGDETHLPRLVSVIVAPLQHPYGQNVLAGDTLKRLRKSVLLPEELAKVSANAAVELKCGGCGKPFVEGEMATFSGNERVPFFSCSRCCNPSYASCGKAGCDGSGEIDHKAISKAVSKADCGQHTAEGKPKVEAIPEEVRRGGVRIEPADGRLGNPFEGHPDDAPAVPPEVEWRQIGREPADVRGEVNRRLRRPGGIGR